MATKHHTAKTRETARAVLHSDDFTVEHPFRASRLTLGPTILDTDGPKQARAKRILGAFLSPDRIEQYRSGFIRGIVQECWALLKHRQVDIVEEFAVPVPPQVIFQLLGLDRTAAVEVYRRDVRLIAEFISDNSSGHASVMSACDRLTQYILRCIEAGSSLNVAQQIMAQYLEEGMSRQEGLSAIILLLAASTETTICAISNLFHFISHHPGSWNAVVRRELSVRAFVEESLRMGVPLGNTVRFARCPTAVGAGVPVERGAVVEVSLVEANTVEPSGRPRDWNPNSRLGVGLAFGSGPHACLGKGLAIAELMETVELLAAERFTAAAICESPEIQGSTFRRPAALRVNA